MKRFACIILAAVAMSQITACSSAGGQGAQTETTAADTAIYVDLEKVHSSVKEAYGEEYIPSSPYDEQMIQDKLGISADLYEDVIAEGPMISVHVDEFAAFKALEGKGEEVEKLLSDYREALVQDSLQYPMNLPKIEASQVIRHGDYVFFVMLGTPDMEALDQGEEAALESAKENNQKAVDIINGFF